jgi:hypothetical protein
MASDDYGPSWADGDATDALAAFTEARLGEDEDLSRDLLRGHPGPWRVGLPSEVRDSAGQVVMADEYHWSPMRHIARHDPDRVLREVASGRRLLALYERYPDSAVRECVELRAESWSDHPEYRKAWGPDGE